MNDATREQQATAGRELQDLFEKSSQAQKVIMKALAGLTIVMDSSLDRYVKFDAIKAAVDMVTSGAECHALIGLRKCNKETRAPLDVIHPIMALQAMDDLHKCECRFNTMMQLFVDEAKNRA